MEATVDVQGKGREGTAYQTWWTLLMMLVLTELINCAVHHRKVNAVWLVLSELLAVYAFSGVCAGTDKVSSHGG
jgi:hypothetical protein